MPDVVTRFRPDQVRRYSRHVLLPDVGGTGQARLLAARVAIDAATPAGRIAAAYLVAAGVGTVHLVGDVARPVAPADAGFPLAPTDIGTPLGTALAAALADRNPDARILVGPAPGDCPRLVAEPDGAGLAGALAGGAAAAARWLHAAAAGAGS